MNRTGFTSLVAALASITGFAATEDSAENWVHRAEAAFDRGDYRAAVEFYTAAEKRTTDPGLVAFDKAAALYRLGLFREAEVHYRRCREDAAGQRRSRLFYNLGTTLVREAEGQNAELLQRAIGCFEECLRQPLTDDILVEDARANLRLARELLNKARGRSERESATEPNDIVGRQNSDRSDRGGPEAPAQMSDGSENRGGTSMPAEAGASIDRTTREADEHSPGVGDLPPIPDQDTLASLSPSDAAAHLRQAIQRISRERQENHPPPRRPDPKILDW